MPAEACQQLGKAAHMEYAYYQPEHGWMYMEMLQKTTKDTFFGLKKESLAQRPMSVATEFVDTDWDEEMISQAEDSSPRASIRSSGQPSFTTVSSYDEVPTPRSSPGREELPQKAYEQVQGPRGPHLFRTLTDPFLADDDFVLTLSPLTPKTHRGIIDLLDRPPLPPRSSPFKYADAELDSSKLSSWTTEMVAQSILNAGIESSIADRFIENDINGAILITLKFEDLRELDIQSFGIRTKIWHHIQTLYDSRPTSTRPATPIEDAPSREARKETRKNTSPEVARRQGSKQRPRRNLCTEEDTIHPMESISIIGIEQVIPKPHRCSKGESCHVWKRRQKIVEEVKQCNPTIDLNNGCSVMIYNDTGNPQTAKAIEPEAMRPISDAVPSVVASSDVLGPGGLRPWQYLQEATLGTFKASNPQDNVRQFLDFQQRLVDADQVPPTPPFELAPPSKAAHQGLRSLPKLSIPHHPQQRRPIPLSACSVPQPAHEWRQRRSPVRGTAQPVQPDASVPYRMDKLTSMSLHPETPKNPYRFGTPFSEMDVPVTTVPVGPVSRDMSQSVPPSMNLQAASGSKPVSYSPSQSRASARGPSFPTLSAVNEKISVHQPSRSPSAKSSPKSPPPHSPPHSSPLHRVEPQQRPRTPPRFKYPWSSADHTKFEPAAPALPSFRPHDAIETTTTAPDGVTCQGSMKKRKTRLLRNEWQDGYFTLRGSRLNMHKDVHALGHTLEYIDIDDYAIACSSLASTSKLTAAFKAVHLSHDRKKSDPVGAFSFQLIPQDKNAGIRLRRRDSSMGGMSGTSPSEGVNGTGKTHHFAVKNRDERIDWMRELMLAKAMKQKREGFEIRVNGNMI